MNETILAVVVVEAGLLLALGIWLLVGADIRWSALKDRQRAPHLGASAPEGRRILIEIREPPTFPHQV